MDTANLVARYTYSGTYNGSAYSGGTWSSSAPNGLTLTAVTGVAVDWSGYTFSTGANGAIIYASNSTSIVKGNDNGTGNITTTVLKTLTGINTFKSIAFSPIKQTVSLGSNTPATGNIIKGTSNAVLFQFNLSADEGNSTIKKVTISQSGTAVLGTDISNFRF